MHSFLTSFYSSMSKKQVQIILTKNVESLGLRHQIKTVAAGFARNYLFPQNLAVPGTKGMLAQFSNRQDKLAKEEEGTVKQALESKKKLEETKLVIEAHASKDGTLFGSISAHDIAKKIEKDAGIKVEKRYIFIPTAIKKTGEYPVTLKLFRSVKARLKVVIESKGEQKEEE